MRILIVEDSLIARTMLKDMLKVRGHEIVAEAENKTQALEAYKTHKPDAVTLDLGLGKDSGLDTLKALRELDPNARVLVITGNPQAQIKQQASDHGAAAFLIKPLKVNDLEAALSKISVK